MRDFDRGLAIFAPFDDVADLVALFDAVGTKLVSAWQVQLRMAATNALHLAARIFDLSQEFLILTAQPPQFAFEVLQGPLEFGRLARAGRTKIVIHPSQAMAT